VKLEIIDIIFIALILIMVIRGGLRGFVEELMSMAAVVLGLGGAFFFYSRGGVYIREKFMGDTPVLPEVLAFVILFLIVFLAIKLLEYVLRDIIDRINLDGADHFLGLLFGIVEGVILVALILLVISIQPLFDPAPLLENSVFARYLMPFIASVGRSPIPGGAEPNV
jgi:membrane protein required for colicin V production